jgi:hypothetical protein
VAASPAAPPARGSSAELAAEMGAVVAQTVIEQRSPPSRR